MTRHSRHRSEQASGFSLLEMLVALVILSFSLAALYQSATAAIRNVAIADEYTRAVALAESMLASSQYVSQEQIAQTGSFDIFRWETRSWPVPLPEDTNSEDLPISFQPLQYINVTVRWPASNGEREMELLTIVPLIVAPE